MHRVVYNDTKVIAVLGNDNSITQTNDKIIVDTLENIIEYLKAKDIDIKLIEDYIKENETEEEL